jgi:uncharacterized DUF497 family protein
LSFQDVKFEWDQTKETANFAKHGVEFFDCASCLSRFPAHFIRYPGLTKLETRWQLVGFDGNGILTVRFTLRRGWVRVIGAGYWRKQKQIYEKENQLHG